MGYFLGTFGGVFANKSTQNHCMDPQHLQINLITNLSRHRKKYQKKIKNSGLREVFSIFKLTLILSLSHLNC